MDVQRNVLGGPLVSCGSEPMTGWHRDGSCRTDDQDLGRHVVCCEMTAEFLEFSRDKGNDLMTPAPHLGFPGVRQGDRWCVCAGRWVEALRAGMAPPVVLAATHERALEVMRLEDLQAHALDAPA